MITVYLNFIERIRFWKQLLNRLTVIEMTGVYYARRLHCLVKENYLSVLTEFALLLK